MRFERMDKNDLYDEKDLIVEFKKSKVLFVIGITGIIAILSRILYASENVIIYLFTGERDPVWDILPGSYESDLQMFIFFCILLILFMLFILRIALPFYNLRVYRNGILITLRAQGKKAVSLGRVIKMRKQYPPWSMRSKARFIPADRIYRIYFVTAPPEHSRLIYGFYFITTYNDGWVMNSVYSKNEFNRTVQAFSIMLGERRKDVIETHYNQ